MEHLTATDLRIAPRVQTGTPLRFQPIVVLLLDVPIVSQEGGNALLSLGPVVHPLLGVRRRNAVVLHRMTEVIVVIVVLYGGIISKLRRIAQAGAGKVNTYHRRSSSSGHSDDETF